MKNDVKFNYFCKYIDTYLKKYEIMINFYEKQHDVIENRRKFYWLVQSGLLIAWHYYGNRDIYILLLINFLAIILSFAFLLIFRREHEAIFFTEMHLRTIEKEINDLEYINFDRFIEDKFRTQINNYEKKFYSCDLYKNEIIKDYWKLKFNCKYIDNIDNKIEDIIFKIPNKIKSTRILLNKIIPLIIIILWIILLLYSFINILSYK